MHEDRRALAAGGSWRGAHRSSDRPRVNELPPKLKDFLALRRSGCRQGASLTLGRVGRRMSDSVAEILVTLGVTPNMLTVSGFLLTVCAAGCLLIGAGHVAPWEASRSLTGTSWWPLAAAVLLSLAGIADLLDGAVARRGNLATRFGGLLDSTLDRFSDLAVFLGCALHFSVAGNVTLVALSMAAAMNAILISYVKARAESMIADCEVGFWQRGERCGLFLLAAYLGHIPASLWLLGTLPIFTVLRRLRHARCALTNATPWEPAGWARHLQPWRHPRGSAGYDVSAALGLLFVIAGPLLWPGLDGASDPLRPLLAGLTGVG